MAAWRRLPPTRLHRRFVLPSTASTDFVGLAAGASTADAVLTTAISLVASSAGGSTAVAAMGFVMAGLAAGASTAVGFLSSALRLTGLAAGDSRALGHFTGRLIRNARRRVYFLGPATQTYDELYEDIFGDTPRISYRELDE